MSRVARLRFALLLLPAMLAGCGSGGGGGDTAMQPGCGAGEYCGAIPLSIDACSDSSHWPLTATSPLRPLAVHYSRFADEARAMDMLAILENAWEVQVDGLGFAAPLDDGGACGEDGRYDVFIWRGVDGAFVDAVADNPSTPYDDYATYMAIDPTGAYGAALQDTTLAHEFNHALQASDDWWESALIFEMSATFVEALVYPEQDDYFFVIDDFQERPEWSLFYDDGYETWYMYGAAMYLHFLYQRYFPDDPAFIARIWRNLRSDPASGRPDYIDSIRSLLLNERGVEFDDAAVEFQQWRWFVAENDDGAHFARGGDWPAVVAFLEVDAAEPAVDVDVGAMFYGAGFVRIRNDAATERILGVDVRDSSADVDWRLTTAAGAPVAGSVTVPPQSAVVLIAAALPAEEISAQALGFDMHDMVLRLTAL